MRYPRFGPLTLMIALAGVALVAWAARIWQLSAERQRRATEYEVMLPQQPRESEAARVGLAFGEALARGDWSTAHALLAKSLRYDWQPSDLRRRYDKMIAYWDRPAEAVTLGSVDSEYVYVGIYSRSDVIGVLQEGVAVRVIQEGDRWLIDDVIWGRP